MVARLLDALDVGARAINAGIPAAREALEKAGVTHEIVIYPGADHAFHNDTGQRYKEDAAKDAWRKATSWFDRFLKAS